MVLVNHQTCLTLKIQINTKEELSNFSDSPTDFVASVQMVELDRQSKIRQVMGIRQ